MAEELAPQLESTNAPAPVETQTAAPAPVESGPSLDDTMAATMAKIVADRPLQGEDGKFTAKAGAPEATPELKVPGSTQTGAPDPAQPVIEAPQSLPANVKALWATLPPDVQTAWSTRESEIHKKFTSDGERLKHIEAFDEALAPAREFIEQNRIPKQEYIRRLTAADHALRTNGPAALAEIARMYGINPGASQNIGQPMDPTLNALVQRQEQVESFLTQQQRAAETARLNEAQKKIDTFKANAPHFDQVEALMTKLYEPGMELAALYDMATKAHPEVSKSLMAEQSEKAKAEALVEQKRKATEAAKLAPFSRKPGSVATTGKPGANWEDTMKAQFRTIKARG